MKEIIAQYREEVIIQPGLRLQPTVQTPRGG